MMNRLYEWGLRHFYGIRGTLDEYRLAEVNAISSRLLLPLVAYMALSSFVAGLLIVRIAAIQVLFGVLMANLLAINVAWTLADRAVRQRGLDQVDVTRDDLPAQIQRIQHRSSVTGILTTGYLWGVTVLLDWILTGWSTALGTLTHPQVYVFAVAFGVINAGITNYRQRQRLRKG